jgi:predicted aconitase
MWPAIAITFFLLALLAAAFRLRNSEAIETRAVLSHTIDVNLGILERELTELSAVAQGTPRSSAREIARATALLQESKETAEVARKQLPTAKTEELENILGQVFTAMNGCTSARRLLNACQPL